MKKWLAVCLALVLVLSVFAGCAPTDEDLLVGKWRARIDLALSYGDLLARADASVAAHVKLSEFKVALTLQFKDDGTFRMKADAEDVAAGAEALEEAIRTGMAAYLQEQTGKTMDNLLATAGLTMDELMERYFTDDLTTTISENLSYKGTYKLSGGKLILYKEDGSKVFEGKFAVDEEDLELKSGVTNNLIASLLPLKLNRK